MSHVAEFYASWCFYCNTKHESPDALRKHVGSDHPGSIREARYRAEEESHGQHPEHAAG